MNQSRPLIQTKTLDDIETTDHTTVYVSTWLVINSLLIGR